MRKDIPRNYSFDSRFLSAVSLLSRGWIVPVGGSTPDRHKIGSRPESSTPAKYPPAIPNLERHLPEMNLLIDSCFMTSVSLLSRGWIVPVGGSTPDRHKIGSRPESSTPAKFPPAIPNLERHLPEMNLLIDSCFMTSVSLLSRGWIVPVGGATPDRHKAGGATPDRLKIGSRLTQCWLKIGSRVAHDCLVFLIAG